MRRLPIAAGLLVLTTATVAAQQPTPPSEGQQLFQTVCAMCHSVTPPAKLAPPISHAAAYYMRRHPADPVTPLVAYLKAPAAERSAMPAHVIERFGVMPAQAHLSDAQLTAVAKYVLSLADTVHVRHRPGHGSHQR